jgi:hypothetical protein
MKRINLSGLIGLFVLMISTQSVAEYNLSASASASRSLFCGDWDELQLEEYLVSNNVWGKGNITGYKQCIFGAVAKGRIVGGWIWQWPTSDDTIKAYPEIIFGWKPWNASSTTPDLPIQVGSIASAIASHEILVQRAGGGYNTSFDLWITSQSTPTPENITREVMVWLNHKNLPLLPGGTRILIDGDEYDFYTDQWDWTYFAFIKVDPVLKGSTNLYAFIQYLVDNSYISSSEFWASVEFGNEIAYGKGGTAFFDYMVQVK